MLLFSLDLCSDKYRYFSGADTDLGLPRSTPRETGPQNRGRRAQKRAAPVLSCASPGRRSPDPWALPTGFRWEAVGLVSGGPHAKILAQGAVWSARPRLRAAFTPTGCSTTRDGPGTCSGSWPPRCTTAGAPATLVGRLLPATAGPAEGTPSPGWQTVHAAHPLEPQLSVSLPTPAPSPCPALPPRGTWPTEDDVLWQRAGIFKRLYLILLL